MRIVALLLLSLCTMQASATDKIAIGKTITTEKGNVIIFSAITTKELHIANTNEQRTVEYGEPKPILLNGKDIYYVGDKNDTVNNCRNIQIWIGDHVKAWKIFDKELKKEKRQLPKGSYEVMFKDVVINEQGNIVYFRTAGIVRRNFSERLHVKPARLPIADNTEKRINDKLIKSIEKLQYAPLMIGGNATPYYNHLTYSFDIK